MVPDRVVPKTLKSLPIWFRFWSELPSLGSLARLGCEHTVEATGFDPRDLSDLRAAASAIAQRLDVVCDAGLLDLFVRSA